VIRNELGLHLRAAAVFVKVAEGYKSDVTLFNDSNSANGKSIIALVTLAAAKGTPLRVVAEGPDAADAAEVLARLVEDRFGEDS
jgi:phosphotransferase system HPr (HPr) family protein